MVLPGHMEAAKAPYAGSGLLVFWDTVPIREWPSMISLRGTTASRLRLSDLKVRGEPSLIRSMELLSMCCTAPRAEMLPQVAAPLVDQILPLLTTYREVHQPLRLSQKPLVIDSDIVTTSHSNKRPRSLGKESQEGHIASEAKLIRQRHTQ